jgi:DNA ligase D-like protein (predicted 3'-phosphoesterase)
MMEKNLEEYRRKRDFGRTAEPSGEGAAEGEEPGLLYVVQKHAASSLHYDFRLEVNGALASWAVPKGPPAEPGVRRLAVRTEDHPLAYAGFEGTIPEGEYGAGTVEIWDRGTYRNLRQEKEGDGLGMPACIEEGKVEIRLEGRRLRGRYALIRTGPKGGSQWLLMRMKDRPAGTGGPAGGGR